MEARLKWGDVILPPEDASNKSSRCANYLGAWTSVENGHNNSPIIAPDVVTMLDQRRSLQWHLRARYSVIAMGTGAKTHQISLISPGGHLGSEQTGDGGSSAAELVTLCAPRPSVTMVTGNVLLSKWVNSFSSLFFYSIDCSLRRKHTE